MEKNSAEASAQKSFGNRSFGWKDSAEPSAEAEASVVHYTAKVNITKVIENVETDNVEKNHRKNPSPIILDLAR